MLELFFEYFEGYFNNQTQAFTFPREFALIELTHQRIEDNKFQVKQKYVYESKPYRDVIIQVTEENDKILIKNFNDDGSTYLTGCDTIFEFNGTEFHGKNICNECFVERDGKNTYLMTESFLGNGYYKVIDKGMDIDTHEHIWGSFNGFFEFDKK